MSKLYPLFIRFFAVVCLFGLSGCDFETKQSTLDPKGPLAAMQLDLFMVTVWISLLIFVIVGGALLFTVLRFRQKKTDKADEHPHQGHGHAMVEIMLIGASVLLLVIIAIPTLRGIWYMHEIPEDPNSKLGAWYTGELAEEEKNNVLEVNVMGYQWWWRFEYPQLGLVTANELAIPVGKVIKINLQSADVIHSFWLPKIAGKVDLIPGRFNWMWIQGDEIGHYYGQCAEFCGDAHAYMLFRSDVLSEEDFHKWVEHQKKDAYASELEMIVQGKALFAQKQCVQCHMIKGNSVAMGVKGPDLTHVASRSSLAAGILDNRDADGQIDPQLQRENFFNWVKNSQHIKPGNLMYYDPNGGLKDVELNDGEVHKIVAYLQTLK